jgi:hypothetical protein
MVQILAMVNRGDQREIGSQPEVGMARLPNFWRLVWLVYQVTIVSHADPCFFSPSPLSHLCMAQK